MRKQIVPLSGVVLLSPKKIKKFLCRNYYIVIVGTMVSLAYVKRHGLSVGYDLDLAVLGPFIAFRCLLSQGVYLLSGRAITQRHQASDSTFIRVTPRLFSRHLHMRLIGQIIRHSDCRVDASAVSWLESGAALLGSFQIAQSRRNRL